MKTRRGRVPSGTLPLCEAILAASYSQFTRAAKPSLLDPERLWFARRDKHRQYCWERPEPLPTFT